MDNKIIKDKKPLGKLIWSGYSLDLDKFKEEWLRLSKTLGVKFYDAKTFKSK